MIEQFSKNFPNRKTTENSSFKSMEYELSYTKLARERLHKYKLASILSVFLTVSSHGQVESEIQSLEIEPHVSWKDGTIILRNNALSASVEVGVHYIDLKNGDGRWVNFREGDVSSVNLGSREVAMNIEDEIENRQVEKVCAIHTHPIEAALAEGSINKAQYEKVKAQGEDATLSLPPSYVDISFFHQIDTASKYKQNASFDFNSQHINVVFDPAGLWYFRPAQTSDLEKHPSRLEGMDELKKASDIWTTYIIDRIGAMSDEEVEAVYNTNNRDFEFLKSISIKANDKINVTVEAMKKMILTGFTTRVKMPELENSFFVTEEGKKIHKNRQEALEKFFQLRLERTRRAFTRYIIESIDGNVPIDVYEELKTMYVKNGTMIRFVPFDKIASEPVCAGVDYQPADTNQNIINF